MEMLILLSCGNQHFSVEDLWLTSEFLGALKISHVESEYSFVVGLEAYATVAALIDHASKHARDASEARLVLRVRSDLGGVVIAVASRNREECCVHRCHNKAKDMYLRSQDR